MAKPIEVVTPQYNWENSNQAIGKHNLIMRGTLYRNFTIQVALTNSTLKIYASNKKEPGVNGWIDFSSYFSATPITSKTLLVLTADLKVLWWKFEVTTSNGVNVFNLYLNRYNKYV